MINHFYIGNL